MSLVFGTDGIRGVSNGYPITSKVALRIARSCLGSVASWAPQGGDWQEYPGEWLHAGDCADQALSRNGSVDPQLWCTQGHFTRPTPSFRSALSRNHSDIRPFGNTV